jgi:aldehyde dehydrogenase (NAD+)
MTAHERADVMQRLLTALQSRAEEMAVTITTEMGSPISFSNVGQVMASHMVLDYFVNLARQYPFEEVRPGMLGPTLVRREPVGVAACIVPWNVPLFTTALKLGPALAAGCTVVLKPAPETPLDSFLLADAVLEAEVPPGVINIVPAGREVGEHLVKHPGVDKVAFTGSTTAGRRIASLCGAQLKRVTLELGGKSAAIFLDDVDLGQAIPGLLPAAFMNNGQACVGQTRLLASRKRYHEVCQAFAAAVRGMQVGDPMDPATLCGPLVAARQRDRVEGYIALGRKEGAKIAVGGGRPAGLTKGWYVEPTVFVDVDNKMRIAQEEIFGPVVAVIPYDDEEDAVRIANESDYGLSGSVWTADVDRGLAVARRVRTGTYTVNGFMMEFSAPFGGFKCSGLGRELGPEGLSAYLESKSINLPMGYEVKVG